MIVLNKCRDQGLFITLQELIRVKCVQSCILSTTKKYIL